MILKGAQGLVFVGDFFIKQEIKGIKPAIFHSMKFLELMSHVSKTQPLIFFLSTFLYFLNFL